MTKWGHFRQFQYDESSVFSHLTLQILHFESVMSHCLDLMYRRAERFASKNRTRTDSLPLTFRHGWVKFGWVSRIVSCHRHLCLLLWVERMAWTLGGKTKQRQRQRKRKVNFHTTRKARACGTIGESINAGWVVSIAAKNASSWSFRTLNSGPKLTSYRPKWSITKSPPPGKVTRRS